VSDAGDATDTVPRLELRGIAKRYGDVIANDAISLRVMPGQIHAVLGENGAGKSTLVKIVYGAVRPDAGEIRWDGRPAAIRSPAQARALGIGMVYQHFSLFDSLTVAENVWLGLGRGRTLAQTVARLEAVSADLGLPIDPRRPVHALSVGERQRVEILRALLGAPRLLILDEPTSVLAPQAIEPLFAVLRRLAERGCAILYISHKLEEIRTLCHHCTVLRAGRVTGEVDPARETAASLSRLMIGAEPPPLQHRPAAPGAVALELRALSLPRATPHGRDLHAVDLRLRGGEILGIAGVSGNGQQELMALLSGEDRRAPPGALRLYGEDVGALGPQERRARGLRAVPEERLGRAAVPVLSLAANTLLTRREALGRGGWLRRRAAEAQAATLVARFRIAAAGPRAAARSLSGGNLQKFIVGREIDARPRVLLASQPTWGVDVGAATQIRAELLALRDAGCALLVVSEELEELFEIADRLQVMAQGRLSPSLAVHEADAGRLGTWMGGGWREAAKGEGAAGAAA